MNRFYHTQLGREKAKEEKSKKAIRAFFFDHSSAVLIERVVAVQSLGAKRKETELPPLMVRENDGRKREFAEN